MCIWTEAIIIIIYVTGLNTRLVHFSHVLCRTRYFWPMNVHINFINFFLKIVKKNISGKKMYQVHADELIAL